jgi:hypothetical protein
MSKTLIFVAFLFMVVCQLKVSFSATYYQFTNATMRFIHDDEIGKDQFYSNRENE